MISLFASLVHFAFFFLCHFFFQQSNTFLERHDSGPHEMPTARPCFESSEKESSKHTHKLICQPTHMHIHVHTYIYIYSFIHIYMHSHAYKYAYLYKNRHIEIYVFIYPSLHTFCAKKNSSMYCY